MDVVLQFSLVLLAAALAAWFAVHTYFMQREHELILSRYLEGGLDLLAAEVERVTATFNHNWARCLAVLKSFRDLEEQFDVHELSTGFLELQSGRHNIVAQHRLFILTGAREYWDMYQKAMAYYTTANSILVKEIPEALRVKLTTDQIENSYADIAKNGFTVAKEQDDGSHIYVQLIAELQCLSAALESERYRFKDLCKFRCKPEVQESMKRTIGWLESLNKPNPDPSPAQSYPPGS